jgi:hypothetical protein
MMSSPQSFWRKQLILRRGALEIQWRQAFPRHRFEDLRLQTAPVPYRSTFLELCEEADRKARPRPVPEIRTKSPTPQVTVEAIMLTVRERGVIALNDEDNIARLRRCDAAAKAQIDRRISTLKNSGQIR